jgi:hypothetical protein
LPHWGPYEAQFAAFDQLFGKRGLTHIRNPGTANLSSQPAADAPKLFF